MVLLGYEAQLEACFIRLEIVLILRQDRCTVCAERTIDLEIALDAPDGAPRSCGTCGTLLLLVSRQSVGAR
jgi:hypothetical protein